MFRKLLLPTAAPVQLGAAALTSAVPVAVGVTATCRRNVRRDPSGRT